MIPLFEDTIDVSDVDAGGKKFENVSRITSRTQGTECDLLFDVYTSVYPIKRNEKFIVVLTKTLNLDGSMDSGFFDQSGQSGNSGPTLLDKFDYCMHGKVYLYDYNMKNGQVSACISNGGLLMKLTGESRHLKNINLEDQIYTLLRKVTQ